LRVLCFLKVLRGPRMKLKEIARIVGLILSILAAELLIMGCSHSIRYNAYHGPELPADRVAIVYVGRRGTMSLYVNKIDGSTTPYNTGDIVLLPGDHVIDLTGYCIDPKRTLTYKFNNKEVHVKADKQYSFIGDCNLTASGYKPILNFKEEVNKFGHTLVCVDK